MKKLNKQGFAALELIIVVVVVGLIAGLGWKIYDTNKKNSDEKKQNSAQSSQPETTTPSPTAATDTDYVTVKEWSVRMKSDQNLKGLAYAYAPKNDSYDAITYKTSLDSMELKSSCTKSNGWGIYRYSASDNSPYAGETSQKISDSDTFNTMVVNGQAKKIGNYYFVRHYPQMACDDSSETQTFGAILEAASIAMFKSLEASN